MERLKKFTASGGKIALAVSGGVDSMAMAFKASCILDPSQIHALTVDHAVRAESGEEAEIVGENLHRIGIRNHHILKMNWSSSFSKQTFERDARVYRRSLLLEKCRQLNAQYLCLAHTMDDELENFIMRLIKGSSLYGLSGMTAIGPESNMIDMNLDLTKRVNIVKPLLRETKQNLYDLCIKNDVKWVEDPTNDDPTYTIRNAIRYIMANSGEVPLALTPTRLSKTLIQLNQKREQKKSEAFELLKYCKQHGLVTMNKQLGTISLHLDRCPEFDGLSAAAKTLFIYELAKQVSPLHLEYRLSTIQKLAEDITERKPYISNYANITTTLTEVAAHRNCQFLTMQRAIPYQDERINSIKSLTLTGDGVWTPWVLWDNRYWFRARVRTGAGASTISDEPQTIRMRMSRQLELMLPRKLHISKMKEQLKGKWPSMQILLAQPLLIEKKRKADVGADEKTILGFPLLEKTAPMDDIELQWHMREFETVSEV